MKFMIFLTFMITSIYANGQKCELPLNEEKEFEILEVIEIEGVSKAKIYERAILSLAELKNKPYRTIKYRNKKEGVILGLIEVEANPRRIVNFLFSFQVKLEIKDAKYRIRVNYESNKVMVHGTRTGYCKNDITDERCNGTKTLITKKKWKRAKCEVLKELKNEIKTIEKNIKDLAQNEKEDW